MKNIAIFASGSGTNAEKISLFFKNKTLAKVSIIFSNKKNAYVLNRAKNLNIPFRTFSRNEFYNTSEISDCLNEFNVDLIVLAGFLWLIPDFLIKEYPNRIVNIHPALLPKYGGKGMYGEKVHQKVIENCENESGITIHYVNEKYDEGKIIFQAKCDVLENDTPETLAQRIHKLEYKHFPVVIENIIKHLI